MSSYSTTRLKTYLWYLISWHCSVDIWFLIAYSQNDKLKYLHCAEKAHQIWLDIKHLSDAVLVQLCAAQSASNMKSFGLGFLFSYYSVRNLLSHLKFWWQSTALSRCIRCKNMSQKDKFSVLMDLHSWTYLLQLWKTGVMDLSLQKQISGFHWLQNDSSCRIGAR